MAVVDTKAWKAFRIGDLFEIHPTKAYKKTNSELLVPAGSIPVVANAAQNNGIIGFTNLPATEDGRIITFSDTTDAHSIFYQAVPFVGYPHVQGMYCKFEIKSDAVMLFLTTAFQSQAMRMNFDYANKFRRDIALNIEIKLPATPDGQPDWAYMDAYMGEIIKKEEAFAEPIAALAADAIPEGHKLDTNGWKAFRIGDLFEIIPTKGKNTYVLKDGCDLPYVAASRENNGVNRMIAIDNMEELVSHGNCLIFIHIGDAAAGFCHYMKDDFVGMTGKTSCGYLKNHKMTEKIGLFLASVIRTVNEGLYSFGESWTGSRLTDTTILLPSTPDGQPDWAWMEQYMQQQMDKATVLVDHLDAVWN